MVYGMNTGGRKGVEYCAIVLHIVGLRVNPKEYLLKAKSYCLALVQVNPSNL